MSSHCSLPDTEQGCRFAARVALDEAKPETALLHLGKMRESASEVDGEAGAVAGCVRFAIPIHRAVDFVGDFAPASPQSSRMVPRTVANDREEPWSERAATIEGRQRTSEPQEGLLHHILGAVPVTHELDRERHGIGQEPIDQRTKGSLVASKARTNELLNGWQPAGELCIVHLSVDPTTPCEHSSMASTLPLLRRGAERRHRPSTFCEFLWATSVGMRRIRRSTHSVRPGMKVRVHLLAASLSCCASLAAASGIEEPNRTDDWPRWGGPGGDFRVSSTLSGDWPRKGPGLRWRADAEGGHSAPVVDDRRVYVISGLGRAHRVTAHERVSGEVLWSHASTTRYASHRPDWDGPHATPALIGDLLIVVQIDGVVRAHDRRTGDVRWERDLVTRDGVALPQSGWAASPLPYRNLILFPGLGGGGPGALALTIADGTLAWSSGSFRSSHASPILIEPGDRPIAVFHGMDELVGITPDDGAVLWTRSLRNGAADNVSFTPLWDADRRLLLISHRYDDVGTQAFHFAPDREAPTAAPIWTQRRLQVEHGNAVIHRGQVVGSHRGTPGLLLGLDLATGEPQWRARIPKATLLSTEDHLLVLDESGRLHLATLQDSKFDRVSSFQAFDEQSWTVPTLAGRELILRTGSEVVAYLLP